MHYSFILNPTAGNGFAGRKRRLLERLISTLDGEHELQETAAPGHAVELAAMAAPTSDAVVAIGGDGTAQEVSRGLLSSGNDTPLGIIPMGTGNDFIKMLGIPRGPRSSFEALSDGVQRRIDCGRVRWTEADAREREALFVNAVGLGFDARVADEVTKLKFMPGMAGYLTAALRALSRWASPASSVRVETAEGDRAEVWHGSLFLVTSGNGACSGGGFYLTPDASVKDGVLDVCLVEHLSVRRALSLLPLAMYGLHTGAPEVHMHRGQRISVETSVPLPIHADGEMLSLAAHRLTVEVIPSGLTVLVPGQVR